MEYSSILSFDLNNFKSIYELQRVLKKAGLNKKINAKNMFDLKKDEFHKLFIDAKTGNTIAYTIIDNPNQIIPMQEFIEHLVLKPCTSYILLDAPLNIDEILDKIFNGGMNALTDREKKFLEDES